MERLVVGRLCHGRSGPWPASASRYQSRFVSDTSSPMSGQSRITKALPRSSMMRRRRTGASTVKRSNPKPQSTCSTSLEFACTTHWTRHMHPIHSLDPLLRIRSIHGSL